MHVVGRSASLATTRRLLLGGRVSNGAYIGAITHARLDPPSQIRQARIRHRHLATASTSRHDAYLDFKFSVDTKMASLTPPQPPLSWQHTVEDIERLTTEALAKDKQVSDNIVQLPEDKLDFDSVSFACSPPIADRLIVRFSGICESTAHMS